MKRLLACLLAALLLAAPGAALAAERIVSLGSDATEILYALGKGDEIVGVDDTSMYPAGTAKLPKLGYFRALAPEPILAAKPTLVIAADGAGPATVLTKLESAGVKVVRLESPHTPAGVSAKVRTVAAATGRTAEGEKLAADIAARLAKVPANPRQPRMLLLLAQAPGRLLAAGSETAGDSFIRLSGGTNAFPGSGYKPLSAEGALAAKPDYILIPSHVLGLAGGLDAIRKDPALARTPAATAGRIIVVDSLAALNFGPRLPEAVAKLAQQTR
ncbi:ABC transporter substrate-binding protein [Sandaracinobacter sp. RS1-74]|uniref:heme/hemin ABC transporter substrate-binding protein n=1 Tax=Sandaracinobacteroides sayramensis TaxID=2913411 RepID=UPI001EDA9805|nr:ABC transporter substrate-binding protein [Sandaracinobacteroides sayramensis]MCG2840496.1 ABC transporter substrate-binding protein [Sandaracinobacteroides sayramensis]